MDLLDAFAILMLVGVVLLLWRPPSIAQGLFDSFGAGFLPYRADDGWPLHVQEEEPTAWSWQTPAMADLDVAVSTEADPEIIDLAPAGSTDSLERVSIARLGWTRQAVPAPRVHEPTAIQAGVAT